MNTIIETVVLAVAGSYAAILVCGYIGFWLRNRRTATAHTEKRIAVVVAVRNEEQHIGQLLASLHEQTYSESFEVVVVDDHSADATFAIAEKFMGDKFRLRVLRSDEAGKKAALTKGIAATTAEIILVTDGDCIVPPAWIESYAGIFSNEKTEFVAGMVKYSGSGWLRHVLQTEQIFLQVISAGLYEFGAASMCNGANMGFTREFFQEVDGFAGNRYVSGDDVLLLHKAMRRDRQAVQWNYQRGAIVQTVPVHSIPAAITQRHRWISKFRGYRSAALFCSGLIFLCVQLFFPAAIACTLLTGSFVNPFVYGFAVKILVEVLFLSLTAPYFGERKTIPVYPLSVVLYNVISLCAAMKSMRNEVKWKGRKWKKGKLE